MHHQSIESLLALVLEDGSYTLKNIFKKPERRKAISLGWREFDKVREILQVRAHFFRLEDRRREFVQPPLIANLYGQHFFYAEGRLAVQEEEKRERFRAYCALSMYKEDESQFIDHAEFYLRIQTEQIFLIKDIADVLGTIDHIRFPQGIEFKDYRFS